MLLEVCFLKAKWRQCYFNHSPKFKVLLPESDTWPVSICVHCPRVWKDNVGGPRGLPSCLHEFPPVHTAPASQMYVLFGHLPFRTWPCKPATFTYQLCQWWTPGCLQLPGTRNHAAIFVWLFFSTLYFYEDLRYIPTHRLYGYLICLNTARLVSRTAAPIYTSTCYVWEIMLLALCSLFFLLA